MAIPKIQELYDPILGYLAEYRQDSLINIREAMKEYFYMTSEEAFEKVDYNRKYTLFEWRVNTACVNMYHAGLLLHPYRGIYAIADDGEEAAKSDKSVDRDYLWKFKEYRIYARSKQYRNAAALINDEVEPIRKKEYEVIEEVTLENVLELKRQDARFANMMATGIFMLADGQIQSVPVEVLQHDMSLEEYRTTTLSHSSTTAAFTCKADVNGSGKMKVEQKRTRMPVPGGTGSRPRKWDSPEPFVKNTLDNAIHKARDYKNQANVKEAMHKLINEDYKISYAELSRRTGISEDKIRNMCTSTSYNPKFLDLVAIFIKLQVPVLVCKAIFSLAGFDITTKKYEKHFEIIEIGMHFSAPEINALCISEGIDEIFPATIKD